MEKIKKNLEVLKYLIEKSTDRFIICVVDDEDLRNQIISIISSNKKTFVDNIGFKEIKTDEDYKEINYRRENINDPEVKNIVFSFLEKFNQNYIFICNNLNMKRDIYQKMNKNIILLMSPKMYVYFLRHAVDFASFCFKIDFSNIDNTFFNSNEFEELHTKDSDEYIKSLRGR